MTNGSTRDQQDAEKLQGLLEAVPCRTKYSSFRQHAGQFARNEKPECVQPLV